VVFFERRGRNYWKKGDYCHPRVPPLVFLLARHCRRRLVGEETLTYSKRRLKRTEVKYLKSVGCGVKK